MIRGSIEIERSRRVGVYDNADGDTLADEITIVVFDERPRARHDVLALIRLTRAQAGELAEALRR